jgi:ankyrin repeat protein
MKKFRVSSLLLGTFLMPVVSYGAAGFGSADFGEIDAQFAGVVVSDTALFEAIKAQNINLVNYLLDHGANVNAKIETTMKYSQHKYGSEPRYLREITPLVAALFQGNFELVRLLLDRKADVNAVLKEDEPAEYEDFHHRFITPLTIAIRRNTIDFVRLLLERGANVNPGTGGAMRVPIIEAVTYCGEDVIRLLLEQPGIDLNAYENVGTQAFDYGDEDDVFVSLKTILSTHQVGKGYLLHSKMPMLNALLLPRMGQQN